MYEVELKFPLAEPDSFIRQLASLGGAPGAALEQADFYFNHPARDFERTNEAFRIRSVNDRHYVTYKGPVVDSQTKTRREIEVGLEGVDAREKFAETLRILGFRPVRDVRKRRRPFHLSWQGREFEISIDEVQELGTYAEVETLAEEPDRPAAIAALRALVSEFQLPPPEPKSYLALLLAKS